MGIDLPWDGFARHQVLRRVRRASGKACGIAAPPPLASTRRTRRHRRKDCPDYVELMFGIWHAGLAAVPANAKLHGRELGYILQHSGARVCFASSELGDEIATQAPTTLEHLIGFGSAEYEELFTADPMKGWPCRGNDLAWLFYTSGTTGRPKGAMLTHRVLGRRATPMLPRSTHCTE